MGEIGPLGDAKAQHEMRKAVRELNTERAQNLFSVQSTEQGRAFYWHVMHEVCGLESASYDPHSLDGMRAAMATCFTEGRRWVGRSLMTEAQTAFPELYQRMLNERLARAQQEAERQEREQRRASDNED